jgi:uncharacterized protein YbjT (DUF2867 family)
MILVTTAGKVGSAAARLIAQQHVPVRVLVRHSEKVAEKVRDVAAAAAEIAVAPAAHAGKTYWPTGPESLSGKDVAEIFTKVLGRPITFHSISFEEQKQAMIDAGLPGPVAKDNAVAVAWMADGDCDYVTDDVPQILGRPAGSFEQFAIDYAQTFS